MSSPNELPNNPKPVVKDKNPHNYRKVGYSMIIISVSLVIIGLLSWDLADNYHFSSNIMALQEVDTMTPKSGYNVVLFDISQPVGAKLKMLDHGDTLDSALTLQTQDVQQNNGSSLQVLLFNSSSDYNLNLMKDAEVYIQTPKTGYNIILDNYPLAVGAQVLVASHDTSYANATADETEEESQIQGQQVKVLVFTSTFTDNLKLVTGSSTPVGEYAALANQTSTASNATQTTVNQTTSPANATSSNVATTQTSAPSNQTTTTATNTTTAVNQTVTAPTNQSVTMNSNQTMIAVGNKTIAVNQTVNIASNKTVAVTPQSNQTTGLPISSINATSITNAKINAIATTNTSKSIAINETVSLNATGK
ncbi:MAG: hypothetical protein ACREBB_08050 [Nitrosotalea sp.]